MHYIYPHTQFEVRYTHILDFNQAIVGILSPYLRMVSSFNIVNQNTNEATFRLDFQEDLYSIICMWDRTFVLCEGDPSKFTKANSVLKIYWEILQKITELKSFGALRHCLYASYEINILENNSLNEIVSKFRRTYLSEKVDTILNDITEVSITLQKNVAEKQTMIIFGPFSNADIKLHNLFPFKSNHEKEVYNKFGTLLRFQVFQPFNKIDVDSFKNYFEEQKRYSQNYKVS